MDIKKQYRIKIAVEQKNACPSDFYDIFCPEGNNIGFLSLPLPYIPYIVT